MRRVWSDRHRPAPPTAAIISLLHAVDGLGALLSVNDRGWRWVHARAGEIASGSWVDEYPTAMAEVNLAITASAVRAALTQRPPPVDPHVGRNPDAPPKPHKVLRAPPVPAPRPTTVRQR